MARKFKTSEDVILVIDKLSDLYSGPKTISGLSKILKNQNNEIHQSFNHFHPNRLNGFLDGNMNGAVNDKTFQAVSKRLNEIEIQSHRDNEYKTNVLSEFFLKLNVGEQRTDIINDLSDKFSAPIGVISSYCKSQLETKKQVKITPDWSWQNEAIEKTVQSLLFNKKSRTALIIPTGGGKTRIAIEVLFKLILEKKINKAIWVVDKLAPLSQAKKAFEEKIFSTKSSTQEKKSNKDKLKFMTVGKASENISELEKDFDMLIIDEAHHAAANSYRPLIKSKKFTTLLLTATPNRMDGEDIGIDQISFQVTPKYLFDKNCIIRPELETFKSSISESVFDSEHTIKEFAVKILNDTSVRFNKSLICILEKNNVEALYQELQTQLFYYKNHRLLSEDIHFAHGAANSMKINNNDFFTKFENDIEQGILIATGGLVSEGLDIPSLDSVYISYDSKSIINLLQTSGRVLRYSEGKTKATIVQVKSTDLQYFFNSAWLYQDITDRLRPQIKELQYSSKKDLEDKIIKVLENKNIKFEYRNILLRKIDNLEVSQNCRLMLFGISYLSTKSDFSNKSKWRPLFINHENDMNFVNFFNEISFNSIISDIDNYSKSILKKYPFLQDVSLIKDIIIATNGAKKEINGEVSPYRKFNVEQGTSWLINISISYDNDNVRLSEFLDDCINKNDILAFYKNNKMPYAIKFNNPVSQSFAFLLEEEEFDWIKNYRLNVLQKLLESNDNPWKIIHDYNFNVNKFPLPYWALAMLYQILKEENFNSLIIKI